MPRFTAYAVSKAALVALIRGIAAETKASGVTANVVLPSTMDTPANRKAMPDADFAKWVKPESVAAVIGWLASPEAADVTGAVIPVYGGS
jgi:NAD(P)-dependent dehydrogenase (short-subunit alcohol dehydrogenase family)